MPKINYDKAKAELTKILSELESDQLPIEQLSKKVKRAKVLIESCQAALRQVEADLSDEEE